ncbi:uncharacterized protein [Dendropsophus ebraccatus]|uniref:uncharacterized protein n=1 Tax=Dendropsophus ebraccatus TaxID=150705 RepID=UPI0038320C28
MRQLWPYLQTVDPFYFKYYLREEPVISDLGTVTAGIDKTVTCSPPGNCSATSLVIQWKKSDVSGIWKTSSTIIFIPSLDDHQKTITCEMTTSGGNTTKKTILLNVCYMNSHCTVAIGFVSGICIVFSIIQIFLLYIFIIRKKMTGQKTYVRATEEIVFEESPTYEKCRNETKPDEKAENETDYRPMDSCDVTSGQDDVLYSTISTAAKASKVPRHQPKTEYAEIKRK